VTGVGRWGNGNSEVKLSEPEDLPYVIGLVRQSLERQLDGGGDDTTATGRFTELPLTDIASFHQQFVTLTTLSAETGQHRNTLRKILPSHGITPFSLEGQDFGAVYLRGDVAAVLR